MKKSYLLKQTSTNENKPTNEPLDANKSRNPLEENPSPGRVSQGSIQVFCCTSENFTQWHAAATSSQSSITYSYFNKLLIRLRQQITQDETILNPSHISAPPQYKSQPSRPVSKNIEMNSFYTAGRQHSASELKTKLESISGCLGAIN